jgi:hypothetical protein
MSFIDLEFVVIQSPDIMTDSIDSKQTLVTLVRKFDEPASATIRIGIYLFCWFVVKRAGLERRLTRIEEVLSLLVDPNKGSIPKRDALKYRHQEVGLYETSKQSCCSNRRRIGHG